MNLYVIKDPEETSWVEADSIGDALEVWRAQMSIDADIANFQEEPESITFVVDRIVRWPVGARLKAEGDKP